LNDNALPLVATVLTLTINVSSVELEFGLAESEALAVGAFLPGPGISLGQPVLSSRSGGVSGADEPLPTDDSAEGAADDVPGVLSPLDRFILGLDEALEEMRLRNAPGISGPSGAGAGDRDGSPPSSSWPAQGSPPGAQLAPDPHSDDVGLDGESVPSPAFQTQAIDAALETLWHADAPPSEPVGSAFVPPLRRGGQGGFRALGPEGPASAGRPHQDNPPFPRGGRMGVLQPW